MHLHRPNIVPHRVRAAWCCTAAALAVAAMPAWPQAAPSPPPPPPPVRTPEVVPTPSELAPPLVPGPGTGKVPDQPVVVPTPRELGKPDEDITLDVSAYELGDEAPPELRAALAELTAPFVGPGKTFEDLNAAAAEVRRYLNAELGYYLGYAYLPEQTPVDGRVRIAVLLGRLDRVELKWDDQLPIAREVVEGYLAQLAPGSVLRVRDVERVVFLVNDLRGITARFEVVPGSTPGTATLVVQPRADARWAFKLDLDTNGSRFIGEQRLGGQVTMSSPLGRGDSLSASVLSSFTGGLQFALLGYALPVGTSGLRVGSSLSGTRYRIPTDLIPLGLSGHAWTVNAFALYPLVRSRNLNVFTLAALDHKAYADKVGGGAASDKTVNALTLGFTGDFRDDLLGGGVNSYEFSASAGQVRFGAGRSGGLDDAPNYRKLNLTIARVQGLVEGLLLGYLSVRTQYSFDNLDTTEQFRIGGPDGVRAFASGEGTGDGGVIVTGELRWLPPTALLGRYARETVFALFGDAGEVVRRHNVSIGSDGPNTARYAGAGVSVAWVRPGQYALRISVAHPVRGVARSDPVERDPRVYAQFSALF
jgi:hemolysin activation/secretion protein